MDAITSGLVTNLLAAGLLNRVEAGRQQFHAVCREAEFHAELDAIKTEFHKSLREAIEDSAAEQELDELGDNAKHWNTVIERLDATAAEGGTDSPASDRLVFDSEQEAVDRLAREIAAVYGYDLETNPQLQQALKRAVAEAYREAVSSFGERLVETGLDEQFIAEANIEELEALNQLQDRLADLDERLAHPRFYELYHGDEASRRRASRMVDSQALEFVSRPELEGKQAAQRLLVLGPGGSGKSRALAELVANADSAIEHIIRPKAALQSPQDLRPLRSESFQGDVLLVWDDIHAISPETGNTVFRKAVFELEEFLAPEHELHVLAAARSNQVESLPGEIERTGSQLWSPFESVELGDLSDEAIGTLFDRAVAKEGVVASEDVRTAFVEKAQTTDPSPLYVTSVVETVDGVQLTTKDIEVLPKDALTIWQEQCAAIKAANDERRFVLWAVKLLAELGNLSAYPHSLLKGVYTHVLNRDELTFDPPVEDLCQHQWLVPRVAEGETVYVVHDVKTKAIDESMEGRLRAYSTFLLETVERYLPVTEGSEHVLHENYAGSLFNKSSIWDSQVLERHCERALTLDPECATAHITYANILSGPLDDPEAAEEHYEEALAIDPEAATAHYNYANLLWEEYDAIEAAKEHYEETLAIDPETATAHYNYANLLREEYDAMEAAKEHYEEALAIDPEDATAHTNYANLLNRHFDRIETAQKHFEQALTIDPDLGPANNNYAVLLYQSLDAPTEAKRRFERGIDNYDDPSAHYYYGCLLHNELDDLDEGKSHLEIAHQAFKRQGVIEKELDVLYELVNINRTLNNTTAAVKYCERAYTLSADDSTESRWFEGIHALLTETDCRTRYIHGLTAVCDEHYDLSKELFELVWMNRDGHPSGSEAHDLALAAGVMLTTLVRHDGDSAQTCEEIIDSIDPSSLSSPVSLLYESLDGGTTDSLDVARTDNPPQDLPPLERQAVARLLGRREVSDTC